MDSVTSRPVFYDSDFQVSSECCEGAADNMGKSMCQLGETADRRQQPSLGLSWASYPSQHSPTLFKLLEAVTKCY